MKILRLIIISILFIGFSLAGLVSVSNTFASRTHGGSWHGNSNTAAPYCVGKSCGINDGLNAAKNSLSGQFSEKPISEYIQTIVLYFMSFVSVVAVIYVIYAGFQLMISAGDEEKMKNTRQIIIYVIVGILIMWLARTIVMWTIRAVTLNSALIVHDWSIIPQARASYTESEQDSFVQYKNLAIAAIEDMENELRLNNTVNPNTINRTKTLIQQAYDRLPDYGSMSAENDRAKRTVDAYLNKALQDPSSSTYVGNAVSRASSFISRAKIERITGSISASPIEGNIPLSVSFRAENIVDPSGTTPVDSNYIWWMRGEGGTRKELKRGPSLSYTFTKEGNYTVFLDVISGHRNRKGKTDVLPLSISKQISVKPKLGEIILLVNGVNVSNLDTLKISPTIGNMGLILDASASRAIGNGTITKTKWNFGNGGTSENSGAPIVERQVYANAGGYILELSIETNEGKVFKKELQLLVRDPAAVIKLTKNTAHVNDEITMSAVSYLGDDRNITYAWQVQDEDGKRTVRSSEGDTFSHKFDNIGTYIVSLTTTSSNGNVDTDSKLITIESRDPIVSIDSPAPINPQQPNTIIFDASKSFDPDTNSNKGLSYIWKIDGVQVNLDDTNTSGSRGTYTFGEIGKHSVSVTVANAYGKMTTVKRDFEVKSLLTVNILVAPKVAQQGNPVTLIGQSAKAEYFEWDPGDGSASINGTSRTIRHIYQKAGVFNATLRVNRDNGSDTNSVTKKVYVADSDHPMAIINVSNSSNSISEDSGSCGDKNTLIINRSDMTTFDGSSSINVDGNTSGLTYTWKYFGKTKTTPSITEKFGELGCFPIELSVRSKKTGATHKAIQYVRLANNPPTLTSISTSVDEGKKDSQKVIVRVSANGAKDPDGVITSYIWYYKTESDPEPQNIQISQKPEMTFVLPNVTEKYYFGVILEDNDGAKVNSMNIGQSPSPLIINNANGNIYLPLITLNVPNSNVHVGEKVRFSVSAKTIMGNDITNKSEYAWDFDGDGRIDQKTNKSGIEHIFPRAGDYNVKVRVTHNGVSNTKYQTIHVRNKLKADAYVYTLSDGRFFLMNASEGVYSNVKWEFNEFSSENPTYVMLDADTIGAGKLTITGNANEVSEKNILLTDAQPLKSISGSVLYQSYPGANDNIITLKNPSDTITLALYGNDADTYSIDTDTAIDSDLDGIPDNDVDNKNGDSHKTGSPFVINDVANSTKRERNLRILLHKDGSPIAKRDIKVIAEYISSGDTSMSTLSGSLSENMSSYDRKKLDLLSEMIRQIDGAERIVLMQRYNTLIENWNDTFDKARSLIDIQEAVNDSSLSGEQKTNISRIIDELLVGDSKTTDEVSVAIKLIRDLIPEKSPNYKVLREKIAQIESHPTALKKNRVLGKEILQIIETDTSISDKYKLHIKQQLMLIVNKKSDQTDTSDSNTPNKESSKLSGLLGMVGGVVKVFFILIGIVLFIILGAFIFYRIGRKDENIGFQDFLIDSVFHSKKQTKKTVQSPIIKKEITTKQEIVTPDPLESYVPPQADTTNKMSDKIDSSDPLTDINNTSENTPELTKSDTTTVPDWLKSVSTDGINTSDSGDTEKKGDTSTPNDPLSSTTKDDNEDGITSATDMPDWLKSMDTKDNSSVTTKTSQDTIIDDPIDTAPSNSSDPLDKEMITKQEEKIHNNTIKDSGNADDTPDWLKGLDTSNKANATNNDTENTSSDATNSNADTLPDWLVTSLKETDTTDNNAPDNSDNELPKKEEKEEKIHDNTIKDTTEPQKKSESRPIHTAHNKKKRTGSPKINKKKSQNIQPSLNKNAVDKEAGDQNDPASQETGDNLPDWIK